LLLAAAVAAVELVLVVALVAIVLLLSGNHLAVEILPSLNFQPL